MQLLTKKTKFLVLAIFLILSILLVSLLYGYINSTKGTRLKIGTSTITVEVAADYNSILKGLMDRPKLANNHGMLFIYPKDVVPVMWMKNMKIPLDMIWLNSNMEVVYMQSNIPPCTKSPCQTYATSKQASYVLEVNAGFIERHKIKIGDKAALLK